jgi:hypothetical protein
VNTAITPPKQQPVLNLLSRFKLRRLLIVPFVLQIGGAVSLVGYFSLKNGQEAIANNYLAIPHPINQVNVDAVNLGLLNLQDFEVVGHYFWKQMKVFNIGYTNYANEAGEFIGVKRLDDGTLLINETRQPAIDYLYIYAKRFYRFPPAIPLLSHLRQCQPPRRDNRC